MTSTSHGWIGGISSSDVIFLLYVFFISNDNGTAHDAIDKRVKIIALSLAKQCNSMKLDLLTNSTVVDDAVRFVLEKAKANSVVIESMEGAMEDSDIQRSEDESK